MAFRYKTFQRLHNRIRVDEYANLANSKLLLVRLIQNQHLKKESDNLKEFSTKIKPEFDKFMKKLNLRSVDNKSTPAEQIENYLYYSFEDPLFQVSRQKIEVK